MCIQRPNVAVHASAKLSRRTDRHTDGVTDSPKSVVWAQFSLCSHDPAVTIKIETIIDSLQVTGAKSDLCPGSFISTGANAPVIGAGRD